MECLRAGAGAQPDFIAPSRRGIALRESRRPCEALAASPGFWRSGAIVRCPQPSGLARRYLGRPSVHSQASNRPGARRATPTLLHPASYFATWDVAAEALASLADALTDQAGQHRRSLQPRHRAAGLEAHRRFSCTLLGGRLALSPDTVSILRDCRYRTPRFATGPQPQHSRANCGFILRNENRWSPSSPVWIGRASPPQLQCARVTSTTRAGAAASFMERR